MWKSANPHTSDMGVCHDLSHSIHQSGFPLLVAQDSPRSSANSVTTTTTSDLSTAQTSSQTSLSASSTAFLASQSEVRFALETNFALQSALLSIEPAGAAAAAAAEQQPTATTPAHDVHFSPSPSLNPARFFSCPDNDDDDAEILSRNPQSPPNIHFASDPNECYRLIAPEIQSPTRPDRCGDDASSIPLQGEYVDIFDNDDDDGDLLLLLDGDDADLHHDPPPPPPLDYEYDLSTSVRKFAWSYARGLSALVLGRRRFGRGSTHSAGGGVVGRSVLVGGK